MNIILRRIRNFVIYYVRNSINVDAARRNIGCNKYPRGSVPETPKRGFSLSLAAVRVNPIHVVLARLQDMRKPFGATPRSSKYQNSLESLALEKIQQQSRLGLGRDRINGLIHHSSRNTALAYLDQNRLVHCGARDLLDGGRHRCREQEILTLFRKLCQNPLYCRPKAHIKHSISFIKHKRINL
jgi:hypothetical protein